MATTTLQTNSRDASTNAIVDQCDVTAAGTLEIGTAAFATVLAIITLPATAFSASSTGVATLLGVPLSDTAANATGTAAEFRFKNNAGTVLWGGDVTATGGGGSLTMPSLSITTGEPVRIDAYTFTTPA